MCNGVGNGADPNTGRDKEHLVSRRRGNIGEAKKRENTNTHENSGGCYSDFYFGKQWLFLETVPRMITPRLDSLLQCGT